MTLVVSAPNELEGAKAIPGDDSLVVHSLEEILKNPDALAPPAVVVPRLAWAGRVTLFAAREKDGKSTLAGAAAAVVSSGGLWLGDVTERGSVVWVGLEEHQSDVARRLHDWGAHPGNVWIADPLSGVSDPIPSIQQAVTRIKPRLLVIDTLAALVSSAAPDPGNASAWTPLLVGLTHISRSTDAALLLIHHARKSDGAYRDSTAIGANVDCIAEMSADSQAKEVRKMRCRARWPVGDYSLRLAGVHYELVGGELTLEARVLACVKANPGSSLRKVREGISGRAQDTAATVHRLVRGGLIEDRGNEKSGMKLWPSRSAAGVVPEGGSRPVLRGFLAGTARWFPDGNP